MADYTSTTQMPPWAQPYAEGYLGRAQQVADQPYQQFTGQRVADMNPWMTQGLQAQAQRGMSGSPVMSAANQTLTNTINGGYLNGNPYLDNQIQAAQGDLTQAWNTVQKPAWDTAMQRSGSFGNANLAQANQLAQGQLQQNLGRIGSDMRFNAYNAERGNQMAALGMAPGFAANDYNDISKLQQAGQAYQSQNQALLDDQYARFTESRAYPQQQLGIMGDALGRTSGQSTTQPGPSSASQAAGGAALGLALWNALFKGG